jgi:hypothetical protein
MAAVLRRLFLILLLAGLSAAPVFSQEQGEAGNPLAFGLALGIGVNTFNDPGGPVTYQSLTLFPDIGIGQFGIGLDITLNYRFTSGSQIVVRQDDWIPADFSDFLSIYLSKIAYIRWGLKGDPLFIKAGSLRDGTLGNGFIMADYDNTLFMPGKRIFGLSFDLDGALFDFPFVGIETVVGNLAFFDVVGGRLYVRPLAALDTPVIKDLELGGTIVADTLPDLYNPTAYAAAPIMVFGGDLRLPIVSMPVFSLATFADLASIQGKSMGGAIGLGGRLISFLSYGAQFRILGPNFIPSYFDATYDLFRSSRFDTVQAGLATAVSYGWLASLGTTFLEDKFIFTVVLDGPFGKPYPDVVSTDPQYVLNYPHLRGILTVAEGVIPGISVDCSYDKEGITSWAELISPLNASIQAKLNYMTGPAVISFIYMIRYAPGQSPDWIVTSGLQSSIKLF